MPAEIPTMLVTFLVGATLFTVMFALGLALEVGDLRWTFAHPGLVARSLFSVFVVVPIVAMVTTHLFDLPLVAQLGVVLMAISPGAPVALRRSIMAGSRASFAAALQLLVAALAIVTMPVWVEILNRIYGTSASISPTLVMQQVVMSQLLPLVFGLIVRRAMPAVALEWLPTVQRVSTALLVVVALMLLLTLWRAVLASGLGTSLAAVTTTLVSIAIGHALGGPSGNTRSALAIASGLRNAGLALLVATSNGAPLELKAAVLAYLLWAAATVTPYIMWRQRAGEI